MRLKNHFSRRRDNSDDVIFTVDHHVKISINISYEVHRLWKERKETSKRYGRTSSNRPATFCHKERAACGFRHASPSRSKTGFCWSMFQIPSPSRTWRKKSWSHWRILSENADTPKPYRSSWMKVCRNRSVQRPSSRRRRYKKQIPFSVPLYIHHTIVGERIAVDPDTQ